MKRFWAYTAILMFLSIIGTQAQTEPASVTLDMYDQCVMGALANDSQAEFAVCMARFRADCGPKEFDVGPTQKQEICWADELAHWQSILNQHQQQIQDIDDVELSRKTEQMIAIMEEYKSQNCTSDHWMVFSEYNCRTDKILIDLIILRSMYFSHKARPSGER